jgi:L-ascorbate metabolism protein UlaG (beta-lactamase superfamily)
LKIRYLGHSCVEIIGKHHILIDPDFVRPPLQDIEFICVSHAHKDHIGKIKEVLTGTVLASPDVCEIALSMGIPQNRLHPVSAGETIENIEILPGFSVVKDPVYTAMNLIFRRRMPEPGGTPLSYFIRDEADLLHIGDAHEAPLKVQPDVLCLPWRTIPFGLKRYKETLIRMANDFGAPYILPIHYDLPRAEADPRELTNRVHAKVLEGKGWHDLPEKVKLT